MLVEIPDELIPKGWEIERIDFADANEMTVSKMPHEPAATVRSMGCKSGIPTLILRRKPPVLKAIVFDVAGEARLDIAADEWYIDAVNGRPNVCDDFRPRLLTPCIPLTRREVYEGDE